VKSSDATSHARNWHQWMPWLVLASGIAATALITAFVAWAAREHTRVRFEAAILEAERAIQTRLEVYRALLRGAAGLFAGSTEVTRDDFRQFLDWLRIPQNYPGVQGIGYSVRISPQSRQALIDAARADGLTNFTIWPTNWAGEQHAIFYLEPLDRRNLAAMGYNMFSHPVRRVAMERARDSGETVASGKVELVQEIDNRKQAGFLFYTPVYAGGLTPRSIQERREKLAGFVYSPFRADNLFAGIFANEHQPELELEVYDGTVVTNISLMHRSSSAPRPARALRHRSRIDVGSHTWTLVFYGTPHLDATPIQTLAPLSAMLGVFATLLLFGTSFAQRRAHLASASQHATDVQRAALRADVSTAFTGAEASVRAVLQSCTDSIVRYLPAAFARIWTVDPAENVLVLQASSGIYTHINGEHSRVPVGKLKIGLIAGERRPYLTNDIQHDPRLGDPEWARRERMVAFAGYPMLVEDRVVGVVAMFAREKLPNEILETLGGISDLIAQGLRRREAEEALRAAQEKLRLHADDLEVIVHERTKDLEETVRSLESFSYSIAHDLRAPLRTIHSFSTLLLDEHGKKLDDQGRDFARRIHAAADRMDDLIKDLLAYNRVSRESLPMEPTSLDGIVSAVLDQLNADIMARNAVIHVHRPLPPVLGNTTLLEQVMANLVGNALKFVAPGTAPHVEIKAEEHDGKARVTITDNGIGIAQDQFRRIFGVFERLHAGPQYPGTGMGLAIVQKALERMGGTVGVESAPGSGSTFWFELPSARNVRA
jgi:signal transduction histidine kinase/CHASE1-domain containing sensor protein